MCAALLTGVWWVFPLIAFVLCLGFMLVVFGFARTGRGCMCMGAPRGTVNDQGGQAGPAVPSGPSH